MCIYSLFEHCLLTTTPNAAYRQDTGQSHFLFSLRTHYATFLAPLHRDTVTWPTNNEQRWCESLLGLTLKPAMQFSSSPYFPVVWTEWLPWNPGLNSESHVNSFPVTWEGIKILLCKLKEIWGLFVTATDISGLIQSHLYYSDLIFDFLVNITWLIVG